MELFQPIKNDCFSIRETSSESYSKKTCEAQKWFTQPEAQTRRIRSLQLIEMIPSLTSAESRKT